MEKFFQLIHVCDLHFGDSLPPPANLSNSSGYTSSSIQALETHDLDALDALARSINLIRKNTTSTSAILVTGDLTTSGSVTATNFAYEYLRGLLSTGGAQQMGFNDPNTIIIPGNHDIWGAATINSSSLVSSIQSHRNTFEQYLMPPTPKGVYPPSGAWYPFRLELHNDPLIYLYGLDSSRLVPDHVENDECSLT